MMQVIRIRGTTAPFATGKHFYDMRSADATRKAVDRTNLGVISGDSADPHNLGAHGA